MSWKHTETVSEGLERRGGKAFGEHIGILFASRDMKHTDLSKLNTFTDEVHIQLDVFGTFVMYRVGRHVDRRDIVAKYDGGLVCDAAELAQELSKPDALCCSVGEL